jgi:glycosyltransferase involved in cell wall biosynthesis
MLRRLKESVEVELRHDLETRRGSLVAQVYCPFLWRHWATGWYTLRALNTRTIVVTDRRQYEEEWPWPAEFLVEWDFKSSPPSSLADVGIFHLHNGWTATGRGLDVIATFPDKRCVASFIGTDANKHARIEGNGEKYRRLFDAIHAAVVPCEFLASRLVRLGCDESKLRVIPWGVEPSTLPRKDPADFSAVGTLKVCMLARMIELKGIDVAIEAADLAAAEARVTLDVVGDGPERERLVALADSTNARHSREVVRIHGDGQTMLSHSYAMDVLRRADCLVNCSRPMPDGAEETLSIAMIEAQMAGLPVVAFWCGGAADIVEHEGTGWLATFPEDGRDGDYEEATAEGLAAALVRLAGDRDKRVQMGSAAARRARPRFSTAVVAATLDSLYRQLAGS